MSTCSAMFSSYFSCQTAVIAMARGRLILLPQCVWKIICCPVAPPGDWSMYSTRTWCRCGNGALQCLRCCLRYSIRALHASGSIGYFCWSCAEYETSSIVASAFSRNSPMRSDRCRLRSSASDFQKGGVDGPGLPGATNTSLCVIFFTSQCCVPKVNTLPTLASHTNSSSRSPMRAPEPSIRI